MGPEPGTEESGLGLGLDNPAKSLEEYLPLPPERLHGQSDIGGDGVSQGQVEHQVVNIGAAPHLLTTRHLTQQEALIQTTRRSILGSVCNMK